MAITKAEQRQQLLFAQVATALWSLLFVFTIFSGYFLLFHATPVFGAFVGAVLAIVAWFFARLIGGHEAGIRARIPLFVALLLISAVGVMNFMFLNLEGRRVFAEAISQAQDDFSLLETRAQQKLTADGVPAKTARVRSLSNALIEEIKNPDNCGQGRHAREIVAELLTLLPDFHELSTSGDGCRHGAELSASYRSSIDKLLDTASWNNPDLTTVLSLAEANKARLQKLENDAAGLSPYGLLGTVKPALKDVDLAYRDGFNRLSRQGGNIDGLPHGLQLQTVDSLGEWSQLLGLIIDRLDRPSTYVYIAIAVGFDWFMVYLFALVRRSRSGREISLPRVPATDRAW